MSSSSLSTSERKQLKESTRGSPASQHMLAGRRPDEIKQLFYKWFFLLAAIAGFTTFWIRARFEQMGLFDLILLPILCMVLAGGALIAWRLPHWIEYGELSIFRVIEGYFIARLCNSFFFLPADADRILEFNDIVPWMGVFILFTFWMFERRKAIIEIGIFIGIGMLLCFVFFAISEDAHPANYRLVFQQMLFANLAYGWLAYLFSWMTEAYTRENARAAMMQKMAMTDPLTGVANRRQMELLLDRCNDDKESQSFGLLLVDLDHFKQVNDQHGHQVGDRVLIAAADAMRHSLRADEALSRWGGEEFLVLLPGLSPEDTHSIGERLRLAIHEQPAKDAPAITASIGIIHSSQADERNQLLQRVDAALYKAKAQGRNQVVVWSDDWGTAN